MWKIINKAIDLIAPPLDPRTGRPIGDRGTANDAIEWACDHETGFEAQVFLNAWRQGHLDEWPEFYDWLKKEGR